MPKVLSSIAVNAPAGAVNAATNDTFSFAGTPSFSGSGGTQRYDLKFEVNNGGGYVTIGAGTELTTAGTNPVVNSASTAQSAITVTCSQAGSYTIRISGAPTTGGSYTVLSATRAITVSAAAIAGTMAATETGSDTASSSGAVAVSGAFSASEAGLDVLAGAGALAVGGGLAAAEVGADTFAGTIGQPAIVGVFDAIEAGSDAASISGALAVGGALAGAESGSDAFVGSGGSALASATGTLVAAEIGGDAILFGGGVSVAGLLLGLEIGEDSILSWYVATPWQRCPQPTMPEIQCLTRR
jgi:hypothetical protein